MLGMEVVVLPGKTIRMNLAICKSFNSDFDGDEMNIHAPQSYETAIELKLLAGAQHHIISPQESKPNYAIVQDSLLGAYLMTKGFVKIEKHEFFNISLKGQLPDGSPLWSQEKVSDILKVMEKKEKPIEYLTGHGLISLILPRTFIYEKTNNANSDEPTVKIYRGVLYEGTLDKAILGSSHNCIHQVLNKEYGALTASNFIDNIQFITNAWITNNGFSIGLEDCMVQDNHLNHTIKDFLTKSYTKASGIEKTTHNEGIKEVRIAGALNQAKDAGLKLANESMSPDNNFLATIGSGSKGDPFNISQISASLGQQNIEGNRPKCTLNHGLRTLPHYPFSGMTKEQEYKSRGFIEHSFCHGLSPQEAFFHAMSGREGIICTSMKTADSGYIQRKIVKLLEDLQVRYDGTVCDTKGNLYQFVYSEFGWDPIQTVKVNNKQEMCDVNRLVEQLNLEHEIKNEN